MPDLDALLAPRGIAIIGASPDQTIIRGKIQHVLTARGFPPDRLYPISRSHAEVQGLRAYPAIAEEAGAQGAALQDRVREIVRRHDMAVCGPNAGGFFNPPAGVVATFSP